MTAATRILGLVTLLVACSAAPPDRPREAYTPKRDTFRDCDYCPLMVKVPAGSFTMGSSAAERERERVPARQGDPEQPAHVVTIAKPFAIGRHEVTVGEFRRFVDETGHPTDECLVYVDKAYRALPGSGWQHPSFAQGDNHPVVCVDWPDAAAYAEWLSKETGQRYRLPSEAEWEYAARAGTNTARYWGDEREPACDYTNVADRSSQRPQFDCDDGYRYTAPVDVGRPNAFGLYTMLGNVGEWVADCGYPDYRDSPADGSAVTSGDCERHVGRGGSWWNDAHYVRAARRYSFAGAYTIVGFRVVRELD